MEPTADPRVLNIKVCPKCGSKLRDGRCSTCEVEKVKDTEGFDS